MRSNNNLVISEEKGSEPLASAIESLSSEAKQSEGKREHEIGSLSSHWPLNEIPLNQMVHSLVNLRRGC
jgi:hypothetical protein